MPFDSRGKFTRNQNWEQDRIDGIDIVTENHDDEDNNFADGLSDCFLRNGLVPMEGNVDMGDFRVRNMLPAALDEDAVNYKQLKDTADEKIKTAVNGTLLVGDVKPSARQADHGSWLLCDGRALLRTSDDYKGLFEAIGTAFGAGDAKTTFNIPDCRGVVVRGVDKGRGLDSGRALGSYQADAAPEIAAKAVAAYFAGLDEASGAFYREDGAGVMLTPSSSTIGGKLLGFKASRSSGIYGRAAEVRVKNIALNYFIKAKED